MHHRVHEEKMQHSSQDLRNEREKIGTILEKADFFEWSVGNSVLLLL